MRSVENSLYRRRWPLCATVRSGKRSQCLIQKDRAYRLHEYLRPYVVYIHTYTLRIQTYHDLLLLFVLSFIFILYFDSSISEKNQLRA